MQRSPDDLIRFVRGPDGQIVPDLACRLPGRGVWVSLAREQVARAVKSKAFARSLRQPVQVPPDLPDHVERLLARRALEALSLANKAGLVVAGFAKVEQMLDARRVAALVHASDAAADGVAKLDRKLAAVAPDALVSRELGSAELSLAMGRPNVVHAALAEGGASREFMSAVERLRRYRVNAVSNPGPSLDQVEHRNE